MNIPVPVIALLSTFIFAFASVYGKVLITKIGNSYHFFLLQTFLTTILFFVINLIFIRPDISDLNLENFLLILISSLFAFIGFITLYRGFEIGNVSVGGVLLSARVLVTIPLAIIVGETYPVEIYLLIIIAVIGSFSVSWVKGVSLKSLFLLKSGGMGYFIVTMVCWSMANTIVRELNNVYHPMFFLVIRGFIFFFIILLSHPVLSNLLANNAKIQFSKNILGHGVLYSFVLITAQTLFIYALGELLLITEAIGVLEGVITFIFALGFSFIPYFANYLKEPIEKVTIIIRSFGVLLTTSATLGVILITI